MALVHSNQFLRCKENSKRRRFKMVQLAKEFYLHEPDYTYKDNAELVLATNKCIDYLNWTIPSDQRISKRHTGCNGCGRINMEQVDLRQKVMHYLV